MLVTSAFIEKTQEWYRNCEANRSNITVKLLFIFTDNNEVKTVTNEAYELFEDMQQSIHIYDCILNENTNNNQYWLPI